MSDIVNMCIYYVYIMYISYVYALYVCIYMYVIL